MKYYCRPVAVHLLVDRISTRQASVSVQSKVQLHLVQPQGAAVETLTTQIHRYLNTHRRHAHLQQIINSNILVSIIIPS